MPDVGCLFRCVTANTATLRSLGVAAPEQAIGKTDFDFLPPERAAQQLLEAATAPSAASAFP